MPQTEVYANAGRPARGYVVNVSLSNAVCKVVQGIRDKLEVAYPEAFYLAPPESLHVTLLDWFDPLYDYAQPLEALKAQHYDEYDAALQAALDDEMPITIRFKHVKASPNAIYIVAEDDGSFNDIRQKFLDRAELLPGMKQPPKIIHSTIARFQKSIDLTEVEELVSSIAIDVEQEVTSFRLVGENKLPMLQYDIIKEYYF